MPISGSTNQDITWPLTSVCSTPRLQLLLSVQYMNHAHFSLSVLHHRVAPGCLGTSGCCLMAAHPTLQWMGLFLVLLFSHLFGEDFYEWVFNTDFILCELLSGR